MKRYLLTIVIFVGSTLPVAAETWEWVDAQGTVSFTDDRENIPKQFRKSAKKLGGESAPAVPAPAPAKAESPGTPLPLQSGASVPSAPVQKLQEAYGGRSAVQWKESFASLNGEIREVDGQLKEKQRLLKEPGTLTRSEYLKLEDEIRRLSSSLTALLSRWELLNKEATVAQVPGEFRQ